MSPRERNLLSPKALLQYNDKVFEFVRVDHYIRSTPYMYVLVNILTKVESKVNRYEMLNFTEITVDSPSYKSWKVLYGV